MMVVKLEKNGKVIKSWESDKIAEMEV